LDRHRAEQADGECWSNQESAHVWGIEEASQ